MVRKNSASSASIPAEPASARISAAGVNWKELYELIEAEEAVEDKNSPEAAEATAKVESFLRNQAGGMARMAVSEAVRDSYRRLITERSTAELYEQQVAAFEQAPTTYILRTYLRSIQRGLAPLRKFVIAVEDPSRIIYSVDLKPPSELNVMAAEISEADKSYAKDTR